MRKVLVRTPTSDREMISIPDAATDLGDITTFVQSLINASLFGFEGFYPTPNGIVTPGNTPIAVPLTLVAFEVSTAITIDVQIGAEVDFPGVEPRNSASYQQSGLFRKDAAGTITQIGSTFKHYEREDDAAWDAVLSTDGTNIIVTVTGQAATDILWVIKNRTLYAGFNTNAAAAYGLNTPF